MKKERILADQLGEKLDEESLRSVSGATILNPIFTFTYGPQMPMSTWDLIKRNFSVNFLDLVKC